MRAFISRLLTYANGEEPSESDFVAIDGILKESAGKEYRIAGTIAAAIDSPLFRGE